MDSPVYRLLRPLGRLLQVLQTFFSYVSALLFAVLFVSFVLQICMRFIFNNPLNWSEELSVICYIWIVFLACAFILRDDQHVVFSLITQSLPEKGRFFCQFVSSLILGGILISITLGVFDYVTFMKVETTSALTWRKDFIYSVFPVFIVVVVLRCLYSAIISLIGIFMRDVYQALTEALSVGKEEGQA